MSDLSAYAQIDPLLPAGSTGIDRSPQPTAAAKPTKSTQKRILNLLSERVNKAAQASPLHGP